MIYTRPDVSNVLSPLVENWPMVPVRLGHPSRFPNRDQPIGTNAGPGSATNRDQWGSTWPVLAGRGGRLIGPGSCYEPGPMSAFFVFRVLGLPLAGAPSPSRRCPLSLSPVPPSSPPSSHRRRALHRFRTHIIRSTIYTVHVDAYIINIRSLARIQVFNYMEIDHICSSSSEA